MWLRRARDVVRVRCWEFGVPILGGSQCTTSRVVSMEHGRCSEVAFRGYVWGAPL